MQKTEVLRRKIKVYNRLTLINSKNYLFDSDKFAMEQEVKKDQFVEDVLQKHPRAHRYLLDQGVKCLYCSEIFWGSMQELLEKYDKDVDQVIADLNDFLNTSDAEQD